MPTAAKIDKVSELTEKMGAAKALFVADFTGIDVATVSELRRTAPGRGRIPGGS